MLSLAFLPIPLESTLLYRPQPAIHSRAPAGDRPWPLREAGTGGAAGAQFMLEAYGYQPVKVLKAPVMADEAPFARLMEQVKAGFGRTLSRLPAVFGVSRQTLYNWLDGDTPKEAYQERLRQLADAAAVFQGMGMKPTTAMLDRTISQGLSFLELLAEGADGKETAKKLVRVVQRGGEARSKLDTMLAGRKSSLTPADIGAPALDDTM